MVTDPVPALRGEPAPTNVAGFGDGMHGGMPYKPHKTDGLCYAARMELIRRAEELAKFCPLPTKAGEICTAPLTNSGYCVGHSKTVFYPLYRALRGEAR